MNYCIPADLQADDNYRQISTSRLALYPSRIEIDYRVHLHSDIENNKSRF